MTEERRGFGFGRLLAVGIVVLVVIGASGIFPFRQIIAQDRSVDLAQEKLDALVAENARLEQQLAALRSAVGSSSILSAPCQSGPRLPS